MSLEVTVAVLAFDVARSISSASLVSKKTGVVYLLICTVEDTGLLTLS